MTEQEPGPTADQRRKAAQIGISVDGCGSEAEAEQLIMDAKVPDWLHAEAENLGLPPFTPEVKFGAADRAVSRKRSKISAAIIRERGWKQGTVLSWKGVFWVITLVHRSRTKVTIRPLNKAVLRVIPGTGKTPVDSYILEFPPGEALMESASRMHDSEVVPLEQVGLCQLT